MKGIVRAARRPPGWVAPGPRPPPEPTRPDVWPAEGEDLCWLAGDWRILQRVDGHRWSLDDLVVAHLAARACPAPPARVLDLGCGLGTVLLFTAWRFPAARLVGIEAQEVSFDLARRSLVWNGVEDRVELRHGDFRDAALSPAFDLVTGTPPYFPHGTGLQSEHVQRAPARFEHRGGVEDYARAAARALAPGGRFVACEAAIQASRIDDAARAAGLSIERRLDVIPREGKAPLVVCFVMTREPFPTTHEALTVRGADGKWTAAFRTLREEMGMPPGTDAF